VKADDLLVLPPDLLFLPAESLEPDVRVRLGATDTDRVLTRARVRSFSIVLDDAATNFVEQFRSPTTVVDAVLRHAQQTGGDPEAVLESTVPLVARLRHRRFLAPAGEAEALAVHPTLPEGFALGDLTVGPCVHLFDDVEVYETRHNDHRVALKILRPTASADAHEMLEREAAILEHLEGGEAPELLGRGSFEGRPYLIQGWCEGVSAASAAARLRRPGTWPADLLALSLATIRAYAALHDKGIVHADVHPGNVRVGAGADLWVLDYGLSVAAAAGHLPPPRRGGIADYFEPEYCRAILAGDPTPAATLASDQYALAALVYLMLSGSSRRAFSMERDAWLHDVAIGGMDPLAQHGLPAWPALEAVLERALSADPADRFPSVATMADAFETAISARPADTVTSLPSFDFVEPVLERLVPGGFVPLDALDRIKPPRCSVNFGGAGIAWFLYRVAASRGDASLLAAADLWLARTHAAADDPAAFASADVRISPLTVGAMSPFHHRSGGWLVDAHIAIAMGDLQRASRSATLFAGACANLGENPDLTLGWSSVLLACSALIESSAGLERVDISPVHELGRRAGAMVTAWLTEHRPGDPDLPWYGIAHGWAGLLFGLLRWSQATGEPAQSVVPDGLAALAAIGRQDGRGIRWPVRSSVADAAGPAHAQPQTGWCHGSAGYLQLWTLAGRLLGDGYLELAQGARQHLATSFGRDGNHNGSLCCGFAGQAYALLAFHRWTGDAPSSALAKRVAELAIGYASLSNRPDSLYKGDIGIASLVSDLARPQLAAMPLFETEMP